VDFSGDSDNVRYDAKAKQIVVGFGDGALGFVDVGTNKQVGTVRLSGQLVSFQLMSRSGRVG